MKNISKRPIKGSKTESEKRNSKEREVNTRCRKKKRDNGPERGEFREAEKGTALAGYPNGGKKSDSSSGE